MRVVFMGSPDFSIPTLTELARLHQVIGVVTQPDRPAGRGKQTRASVVKQFAIGHGLRVMAPESLRAPQAVGLLAGLQPELIVVAAYGQILPQAVLDLPPHGCVNVHASLLPRWRGASPVQAAILNGDSETGVSIMLMDAGLDTGPILAQRATPIGAGDTGGSLGVRLARLGADLLIEVLPDYLAGDLGSAAQDEARATHAPRLKKANGLIDLHLPASQLARQVRAYHPWPGSYLQWNARRLLVHAARAVPMDQFAPGQALELERLPALRTGDGALVLEQVQPEGKRAMDGHTFLLGSPGFLDARLLG
ncbi:MAG TPA: methionyl-tRNA formyltransferase [Anaerolineales bacterium]|nr:methionyl-tRNA formyltransferase [Anaerolineales bacterium]